MNAEVSPNIVIKRILPGRLRFLLLCVFMVSILVLLGSFRMYEARLFYNYEEVVSLVKSGKLRADASGDITLPKQWASLTANGHIYKAYDKQSGFTLLFPTDVDNYTIDWGDGKTEKKRDIAGYVYCPGTLPDNGWFSFSGMNDVSTWKRNKAVHPHWYYVEPFYSY